MELLNKKEVKIFLTFFIIYLFFARFQYYNDDVKLDLTRAIIDEHRFEIDSYVNNTGGDRAYYKGHYYSEKAPGASFLNVPVYFVFKLFFGMPNTDLKLHILEFVIIALSSVLFSALLVVLVYKISRFFLKKESQRNIVTILFGLGTMTFVYATIYYHHAVSTFFVFLCFYLIFKMEQEKKSNYYFLAGLSAGIAFITDYMSIILIAFIFFIFILPKKRLNILIIFLFGFSLFVVILLIYNLSVFGNIFTLSYYHIDQSPNDNRINKYDEDLIELWNHKNETIEYINFDPLVKENHFVCVYALTYINSPQIRPSQIRVGSTGNIKIWLNNQLILNEEGLKKAVINQEIKEVKLIRGWNKFLLKECRYMDDYFELFFVITDDAGNIYRDIEYNALINDTNKIFERKSKEDGTKWLIIGPFDYIDENYTLKKGDYFPKINDRANPPEYEIILNKSYYGKQGVVKWQPLSLENQKKTEKSYLEVFFNGSPNFYYLFNFSIRLLFYPYRGLIFYNPILILSFITLFLMYKEYKKITFLILSSFIFLILLIIFSTFMWWGGSSFGSRFFLHIIPFFMLPLIFILKKLNKNMLLIILFLSIFINLLGMQEFEQIITISKWDRPNSVKEVTRNTLTLYNKEIYSMKPLGNPLFTYYMPLFFKYGPRSILIEEMFGFRLPPFLNVFVLIVIVAFIWKKEIFFKENKIRKISKK